MQIILITTLVIALVGLIVGAALVFMGKKFHVEVDERESAVRECLPGNNCGACGYAGCDAMAAAIASQPAKPQAPQLLPGSSSRTAASRSSTGT